MFVNNALHFPCVSSSAHQRTLLFTFWIYFPLSRLSSFLLRACLCSLFHIIGSCVKLGICKAVPSLIGSSSPRSIKFGPAMGASCLKAPWLLWYLTCLNALTFWDAYFRNVHKTVLPSWIKDQDINAPSILRIMRITVDPTTSIPHVMPLLNENSLLLMIAQRDTLHSAGLILKLCKYLPNPMGCKGLELHTLRFGWCRKKLCCSFLKKKKNLYHFPYCPGITSFGEFSNGYHFLFHD